MISPVPFSHIVPAMVIMLLLAMAYLEETGWCSKPNDPAEHPQLRDLAQDWKREGSDGDLEQGVAGWRGICPPAVSLRSKHQLEAHGSRRVGTSESSATRGQ
jgi:hypothetical protein